MAPNNPHERTSKNVKAPAKTTVIFGFMAGVMCGLLAYRVTLEFGGFAVVSRQSIEQQQALVKELERENDELTSELFRPRESAWETPQTGGLPYDVEADASADVALARDSAVRNRKFLMVTFGANWCQDCRNLHWILHQQEVEEYTGSLFEFVNVDVGKFNRNTDVAEELGVSLTRGIPVAMFFDPDGRVIGTTNDGELEPARHYSSKQILKFVRDIVERSRISAPDAVN